MRSLLFLMLTLVHFTPLQAQDLSGKWKGYFIPNSDPEARLYTYEINIIENENHDLSGITYTNLSGNFSAKAIATGFYSVTTKLVSINETKFEDINIVGDMQACLMMNFLNFSNQRGRGILQGTYISKNVKGTRDCGGGKVYLEKEELIKNIVKSKSINTITKTTKPPINIAAGSITSTQNKTGVNATKSNTFLVNPTRKNTIKLSASPQAKTPQQDNNNITTITKVAPIETTIASNEHTPKQVASSTSTTQIINSTANNKPNIISIPSVTNADTELPIVNFNVKQIDPNKQTKELINEPLANKDPGINYGEVLPWVLLGRENKLIKRVVTSSKKISLDLYDNGTIDNDTIIIYDNNKVIANLKRLSYKSIHVDLELTSTQHDIIIVAHNMGSIPPNTALVVLNDANSRQEFFITTTNKVNAKFEFVYKPSD